MSRLNLEDSKIYDPTIFNGLKFGLQFQTLAAAYTMDRDAPVLQFLDPGGAGRTVNLPPEERGLCFIIINRADAAEDLTIKEDSSTTTIGVISQDELAILVCDGTTWNIGVGTKT